MSTEEPEKGTEHTTLLSVGEGSCGGVVVPGERIRWVSAQKEPAAGERGWDVNLSVSELHEATFFFWVRILTSP